MSRIPSKSYSQRIQNSLLDALRPIRSILDDQTISEIMINGPNDVWIRQRGEDREAPVEGLTEATINTAITLLAAYVNKEVNDVQMTLSARLPGFRVEAIMKPIATRGSAMTIRRHSDRIITMQEYLEAGVIVQEQADMIERLVAERKNILIAGGTASGKTTLMNLVLSMVDPRHRLFVIEQVCELQIAVKNYVQVECDPDFGYTATDAVRSAMRFSPKRIIMGELRGAEANDWLELANTGHPGSMATIHSNSASDALQRLGSLVMRAANQMPHEVIQSRSAETVDAVVYIEEHYGKRRLTEICLVQDYDRARDKFITEVHYHPERQLA